jgi:hypothetical protein
MCGQGTCFNRTLGPAIFISYSTGSSWELFPSTVISERKKLKRKVNDSPATSDVNRQKGHSMNMLLGWFPREEAMAVAKLQFRARLQADWEHCASAVQS